MWKSLQIVGVSHCLLIGKVYSLEENESTDCLVAGQWDKSHGANVKLLKKAASAPGWACATLSSTNPGEDTTEGDTPRSRSITAKLATFALQKNKRFIANMWYLILDSPVENSVFEDISMLSADADCSMNNPLFNDDVDDDGGVELVQSCCTLAWPWSEIESCR